MRSEKEIKEFLEKFKEIEVIINPSVVRFGKNLLLVDHKNNLKLEKLLLLQQL